MCRIIIQVVVKMAANRRRDRYQTADEVIAALTPALAASSLSIPPLYRAGGSSGQLQGNQGGGAPYSGSLRQSSYPNYPSVPGPGYPQYGTPPAGSMTCFRCGANNSNTRRFCVHCGDELANTRASKDTYVINGRPLLARFTFQSKGPLRDANIVSIKMSQRLGVQMGML